MGILFMLYLYLDLRRISIYIYIYLYKSVFVEKSLIVFALDLPKAGGYSGRWCAAPINTDTVSIALCPNSNCASCAGLLYRMVLPFMLSILLQLPIQLSLCNSPQPRYIIVCMVLLLCELGHEDFELAIIQFTLDLN